MGGLPSWDEVVDLLRSPKSALSCTVVRTDRPEGVRVASVVFDGDDGWWIEDEDGFGLQTSSERIVLGRRDAVELHTSHHVYWRGLEKSLIEGRLIANLDSATGSVVRADERGGRSCWVTEVDGLRSGEDVTFRLWIDRATGITLLMGRVDLDGPLVEVRDLRIAEEAP